MKEKNTHEKSKIGHENQKCRKSIMVLVII